MGPFEMVAVIVAFTAVAGMVRSHHKVQEKRAAAQAAGTDAETLARINALEERIRVLERIATDKRSRLSDEIDSL